MAMSLSTNQANVSAKYGQIRDTLKDLVWCNFDKNRERAKLKEMCNCINALVKDVDDNRIEYCKFLKDYLYIYKHLHMEIINIYLRRTRDKNINEIYSELGRTLKNNKELKEILNFSAFGKVEDFWFNLLDNYSLLKNNLLEKINEGSLSSDVDFEQIQDFFESISKPEVHGGHLSVWGSDIKDALKRFVEHKKINEMIRNISQKMKGENYKTNCMMIEQKIDMFDPFKTEASGDWLKKNVAALGDYAIPAIDDKIKEIKTNKNKNVEDIKLLKTLRRMLNGYDEIGDFKIKIDEGGSGFIIFEMYDNVKNYDHLESNNFSHNYIFKIKINNRDVVVDCEKINDEELSNKELSNNYKCQLSFQFPDKEKYSDNENPGLYMN